MNSPQQFKLRFTTPCKHLESIMMMYRTLIHKNLMPKKPRRSRICSRSSVTLTVFWVKNYPEKLTLSIFNFFIGNYIWRSIRRRCTQRKQGSTHHSFPFALVRCCPRFWKFRGPGVLRPWNLGPHCIRTNEKKLAPARTEWCVDPWSVA